MCRGFGINMEELVEVKIDKNNKKYILISNKLFNDLLKSARNSQKGRRGLSSKKVRVRKKIVAKELELAIIRGIGRD